MADEPLNPKVLGQLLLMQSVLNNLPDNKSIFSFVCKGLSDIPGIENVRYTEKSTNKESDLPLTMRFPILQGNSDFGELVISISDNSLFNPYKDYLYNFVFMVGVILEERNQRQLLQQNQLELEQRILERTLELKEQSEEIASQNEEYQQLNEDLNQTNQELNFAKQQVEEEKEKFRLMIKNSNDAFVLINEKGEQFFISDASTRDTGFTIEELKGPIQNVIYPEDLEIVVKAWNEVLQKKDEIVRVQYRHKHKFKEFIWYEAVAQNFIENPAINAVVVNVREITTIKKTENELIKAKEKAEESDRLKTAFLQNMSHEIRTPMNAIMGFSELLVDNFENKSKLKKFSGIIGQRCNDLLDIINDILDIAKIESGQLPVNIEECNLVELFAELNSFFTEYQNRLVKHRIKFSLQALCLPEDNLIVTDKVKLKQIFINLIGNAFKFTDEGRIEAGCRFDKNNQIVFYISDTGIGIPLDKQEVIFDRFVQLQLASRLNIGGTGLGLPIVKGLVDLLGGKIYLESEPNKGSTFTFSLPYKAVKPIHSVLKEVEKLNEKSPIDKTILIVEDDFYNSEYLNEILSSIGIHVLCAENGLVAIEMAINNYVDLVLMDIRLPDIDGYSATSQILKHKPHLKIIAQTAYASHDEKQKAFAAGCIDYISKPTKQELLLSMISKYLS